MTQSLARARRAAGRDEAVGAQVGQGGGVRVAVRAAFRFAAVGFSV
ncbi:hypothetical protein [Streptomyces sp. IBSBF 3010]